MQYFRFPILALVLFFLFASPAFANNLVISNVTIEDRNASANTMVVQFNISWDHSWRKNDGRHDAAWVFVKIYQNSTPPWLHGKLYTAGTNPADTSPGTNSDLKIVIPSDKIGAFISRKATGSGTFSSTKVRLNVDYGTSGIADTDTVQVKVFGIEMTYVPEGPFYVGDGDNPNADEVGGSVYAASDALISVFDSSRTFQWAKRLGGTGANGAVNATTNTDRAIIVTGDVTGNADLNGDGDTGDSSESAGGVYGGTTVSNVFISVLNSTGTFQWAKRLGGSLNSAGYEVATDSTNNVIVAGEVAGNADLNGDADTADTNENAAAIYKVDDGFISVFNSSGTLQWSKRLGGTGTDRVQGLAVDNNNNIIATGTATGNIDLNGDGDTADTNESTGGVYASWDAFISVFDSAGTFQWSKRLGGTTGGDESYGVATDTNNNIVVTGAVTGNVDLNGDGDTGDTNENLSVGVYGVGNTYISVFNSSGTFQWSERLGGLYFDLGQDVTTDSNNNVIVGLWIYLEQDLNGDGDASDSGEAPGVIYDDLDIGISVFNSSGTFQWAKRLGGLAEDALSGVTTNSYSDVILTGFTNNNLDLTGDGDTNDTNESTGGVYYSYDAIISMFNSSGTFQWSERLGATASDGGADIATDSNDNIILVGHITGPADLNGDAQVVGTYGFYQSGADDTALQITTTGKAVTVDINSSDDIDTTPTTVTGLAGITGNTSWPNGYDDFYVMKYEISQAQYVDFLNTLTRVQQGTRVGATVSGNTVANYYVMSNGTTVSARNGIRAPASGNGTSPTAVIFGNDFNANGTFNETDDGQSIAMNWLNWPDLAAYADWAGLRPMTEMEFEKAANGNTSPTPSQGAGATTTITQATSISNSGRGSETAGNSGEGMTVYNNHASVQGPLRAGFAATNATNRKAANAGYFGVMELSGNATERAVSLGNSTGRAFTGTQGDGTLTATASFEGNATNNDWPGINGTTNKGVTGGTGGGWRGGNWNDAAQSAYIADRTSASTISTTRDNEGGGRLVRTSP